MQCTSLLLYIKLFVEREVQEAEISLQFAVTVDSAAEVQSQVCIEGGDLFGSIRSVTAEITAGEFL